MRKAKQKLCLALFLMLRTRKDTYARPKKIILLVAEALVVVQAFHLLEELRGHSLS